MTIRDEIGSAYPETLAIPPGVQCDISPMAGQNAITLKWVSGGSLTIVGTSMAGGCTFAISNQYTLSTSEIHNSDLMGPLSLLASGSTTVCSILRYKTPGT